MNSSKAHLKISSLSKYPSVLITSGGTKEPIDSVRYISNISQGVTGSKIAKELLLSGFHVTFLYAKKSLLPSLSKNSECYKNFQSVAFETFLDFKEKLNQLIAENSYQIVIHSAALSDFSIQAVEQGEEIFNPGKGKKLPSQKGNLVLHLKKNEKLLLKLKEMMQRDLNGKGGRNSCFSNAPPFVFGFKLTYGLKGVSRLKVVSEMLETGKVDFVVHNDFYEIEKMKEKTSFLKRSRVFHFNEREKKDSFNKNFHIFRFYKKENLKKPLIFLSKESLAKGLSQIILEIKKVHFENGEKKIVL